MQFEPVPPGARVHLTNEAAGLPSEAPSKEAALKQVDKLNTSTGASCGSQWMRSSRFSESLLLQ